MRHVVGTLMLILNLWARVWSMSSFEDEVLSATHHDSPPSRSSREQLTSINSPPLSLSVEWPTSPHYSPHASLDASFIDIPHLLPPPSPPHVSRASSSTNRPPPPPPPLHVSWAFSSIDPPRPPPHVSPVPSFTNPPPPLDMVIDRPSISSSRGIDASSFGGRLR